LSLGFASGEPLGSKTWVKKAVRERLWRSLAGADGMVSYLFGSM
jgi:hypothetical protein